MILNITSKAPIHVLRVIHCYHIIMQHFTHCHLLQVKNMPPSVTNRLWHSISTVAVSHNCAWLMVIGDLLGQADFVLLELSEWHNETKTSTQCMLMRCCWFQWLLYSMLCWFSCCEIHTHTNIYLYMYINVLTLIMTNSLLSCNFLFQFTQTTTYGCKKQWYSQILQPWSG